MQVQIPLFTFIPLNKPHTLSSRLERQRPRSWVYKEIMPSVWLAGIILCAERLMGYNVDRKRGRGGGFNCNGDRYAAM